MQPTGKAIAGGVLVMVAFAWTMTAAGADPNGSKKSFNFPASCSTGAEVQDLQAVVNSGNGGGQGTNNNIKGQANWAPAHVVGSNQVLHPTAFDLVFTFTPAQGTPQSFHDTQVKPNGKQSTTCSIDYTTPPDSDGNTFGLKGTVKGFIT